MGEGAKDCSIDPLRCTFFREWSLRALAHTHIPRLSGEATLRDHVWRHDPQHGETSLDTKYFILNPGGIQGAISACHLIFLSATVLVIPALSWDESVVSSDRLLSLW